VERLRLKRPLRQDRLVPGKKTRAMPASAQPSALRHSALSAVFPHETATRLPRRTPPNLSLHRRSSLGAGEHARFRSIPWRGHASPVVSSAVRCRSAFGRETKPIGSLAVADSRTRHTQCTAPSASVPCQPRDADSSSLAAHSAGRRANDGAERRACGARSGEVAIPTHRSPSPHSQADLALFLHSALLLQLADRGSLSAVPLHPLARPVARRQARD
jgi:hypothetical protein